MRSTTFVIPFVFLAACIGEAPTTPGNDPDAADTTDAPPVEDGVMVTGRTLDYFSTLIPQGTINGVTVATSDVLPAVMTTSDMTATYMMMIPPGSTIQQVTSLTAFRPTRNVAVTTVDVAVTADVEIASQIQVEQNMYNPVSLTPPVLDTAAVITDMRDDLGNPLVDVPLADVTLVDLLDQPVPGVQGPFFFGELQLDAGILVSVAHPGPNGLRARVGFLDCPVGNYNVKIVVGLTTYTVPIACDANGLTLSRSGVLVPGPAPAQNPTFLDDIYPMLQSPSTDPRGLACVGCHNDQRLAAGTVPWSAQVPAPDLYNILVARLGVIIPDPDPAVAMTSLILTKPLRELPPELQNHPNVTFLSVDDPRYKRWLCWLTLVPGAALDVPSPGTCPP
jgi:hypothetical protein